MAIREHSMKITCSQIEIAVAKMFGTRTHIIVPNISWGLNLHECDLLIINKNGYATEVEIKTSKADLKADLEKRHGHKSNRIKHLYYAMPAELIDFAVGILPHDVGIIKCYRISENDSRIYAEKVRKPRPTHKFIKMPDKDIYHIGRLGVLRYWNLRFFNT